MSEEPSENPKSKRWLYFKIACVLAVAALMLRIFWILSARPDPRINYVEIYNNLTRPANFKESDNAAPELQLAAQKCTQQLSSLTNWNVDWPGDLDPNELRDFENWLNQNKQTVSLFIKAAEKPYCWVENRVRYNDLKTLGNYDPYTQNVTRLVFWNAKYAALKGNPDTAISQILAVLNVSAFFINGRGLMSLQCDGYSLIKETCSSALTILDRDEFSNEELASLQNRLQEFFDKQEFAFSTAADRLACYDCIQKSYVYDEYDRGRLAFCTVKDILGTNLRAWVEPYSIQIAMLCFFGPTSGEIKADVNHFYDAYDGIKDTKPYLMPGHNRDFICRLEENRRDQNFVRGSVSIYYTYLSLFEAKEQMTSLITVCGILRFKKNTGQYPDSLQELVDKGYLKSVPEDYFGPGKLTYKKQSASFLLYSFGRNYIDDGGITRIPGKFIFQPLDLVYWPVERPKRPDPNMWKTMMPGGMPGMLGIMPGKFDPNDPNVKKLMSQPRSPRHRRRHIADE